MAEKMGMAVRIAMDSAPFNQGVQNLKRQIRVVNSNFKAGTAALGGFGSNLDNLKAKATALSQKISAQKQIVEKYQGQLEKSRKVLKSNSQEMLNLKSKLDASKKSWETSKQAIGANTEATKALEAEYKNLNQQYKDQKNMVVKATKSVDNYTIQTNKAKTTLSNMETELKSVNSEIDTHGNKWNQLNANLDKVKEKLKGVGQGFKNVGRTLSMSVTAPLLAAGVASAKLASDMEESTNKVDVAFKKNADEVKKWSNSTLKEIGIAKSTALDMASLYGDMGTAMGQSTGEAAKMSTSLVGLAGDLSSFKNIGVDQAQDALKGIFTGEGEALKSLGIIMQDSTLEAFAMASGQKKAYDEMTQAEKVALRYAFVMDATKNAQGDFARTSGGAANQARIFSESLKEVGATFGKEILPVVTPLLTKLNELIQKFGQLNKGTKKTILVMAGIAAVIGPALVVIGTLISAVGSIAGAFTAVSAAIAGAGGFTAVLGTIGAVITGPVGIILVAVAAIAAGAYTIIKNWDELAKFFSALWQGTNKLFSSMLSGVTTLIGGIKNTIVKGFTAAANWLKGLPAQALRWGKDIIQGLINGIKSKISGIVGAVKDVGGKIKSYLHFSVPDEGPLTDYESWMPDFMEGLAKGINNSKGVVTDAIGGLSTDMSIGVKNNTPAMAGGQATGIDYNKLAAVIASALANADIRTKLSLGNRELTEINRSLQPIRQKESKRRGG